MQSETEVRGETVALSTCPSADTKLHNTGEHDLSSVAKAAAADDTVSSLARNSASAVGDADAAVHTEDAPMDVTATHVMASTSSTAAPLQALYNATGGSCWARQIGWSRRSTKWTGIVVEKGDKVVEINLPYNEMIGRLPESIKEFKFLRVLDLQDNELGGPYLNLEHSKLRGEISPKFGQLMNLKSLKLHRNNLSGEIPKALGQLTNLTVLYLSHNLLTGEIPLELRNLINLEELCLEENQLRGVLPDIFGGMKDLTSFWCRKNQLEGKLPLSLGKVENLQLLMLVEKRYGTNKFHEDPANQRVTNYEMRTASEVLKFKIELTLPVHLPRGHDTSSVTKAGSKRKEGTEENTPPTRGRPQKLHKGPATSPASEGGSSSSTVPLKASSCLADSGEKKIAEREAAVKIREARVAKAESELKCKQKAFSQQERDLKAKEAKLVKQQKECEERKRDQEAANTQERNRLIDLEKSIENRASVLEQQEKDFKAKEANLSKLCIETQEREAAATLKKNSLKDREVSFEKRVHAFEEGVTSKEALLSTSEDALIEKKKEVELRIAKLIADGKQFENQMRENEKSVRVRERALETQEKALTDKEQAVELRESRLVKHEQQSKSPQCLTKSTNPPTGGGSSKNEGGNSSCGSSSNTPNVSHSLELATAMVESGLFVDDEVKELLPRMRECHVASLRL